ncbi:hypothetical protein AAF712_013434 [Marasmius tenuissimus]|uniref:Uncharacterized protein n=1 Tax=Marasmius tenuissimus TaxID=585030 RepID=A0ABR2ZGA2_9AGAR
MERTIAAYERRMQLDSNPYGNLGVEITEQAIANAMYALDPSLQVTLKPSNSPSYSRSVGSGYQSLHPRDQYIMDPEVAQVFKVFCEACGWQRSTDRINLKSTPVVEHFARLRLPNGQITRSRWQETKREDEAVRRARNIKVILGHNKRFAEVLFYYTFTKRGVCHTLAAVNFFSPPDPDILEASLNTLNVCKERSKVTVIDAKWIIEVVVMVPFRCPDVAWDNGTNVDEYFVVEKTFSNAVEHSDNEDEGDDGRDESR